MLKITKKFIVKSVGIKRNDFPGRYSRYHSVCEYKCNYDFRRHRKIRSPDRNYERKWYVIFFFFFQFLNLW